MSKNHYTHSHETSSIEHDAQHLTAKELQTLYGIEFFEDPNSKTGRLFDPVANKEFATLGDWVAHQRQEDEWDDLAYEYQDSYSVTDDF